MKFIIVVDQSSHGLEAPLTSVSSEDIPAKLRRHLELAISMALDFEAEAPSLVPQISVGGISPEDQSRLQLLDALEAWGVDNWEGYSEAHKEAFPEEHEDEDEASVGDANEAVQ